MVLKEHSLLKEQLRFPSAAQIFISPDREAILTSLKTSLKIDQVLQGVYMTVPLGLWAYHNFVSSEPNQALAAALILSALGVVGSWKRKNSLFDKQRGYDSLREVVLRIEHFLEKPMPRELRGAEKELWRHQAKIHRDLTNSPISPLLVPAPPSNPASFSLGALGLVPAMIIEGRKDSEITFSWETQAKRAMEALAETCFTRGQKLVWALNEIGENEEAARHVECLVCLREGLSWAAAGLGVDLEREVFENDKIVFSAAQKTQETG